jgi:hypothetical protein
VKKGKSQKRAIFDKTPYSTLGDFHDFGHFWEI